MTCLFSASGRLQIVAGLVAMISGASETNSSFIETVENRNGAINGIFWQGFQPICLDPTMGHLHPNGKLQTPTKFRIKKNPANFLRRGCNRNLSRRGCNRNFSRRGRNPSASRGSAFVLQPSTSTSRGTMSPYVRHIIVTAAHRHIRLRKI